MNDDVLPPKFLFGVGLASTAIAAGISEHAEAQPQPAAAAPAAAVLLLPFQAKIFCADQSLPMRPRS